MRALTLKGAGAWRDMQIEEIAQPTCEAGEIVVEVHAAGLNPVDYKTATNGNPAWSYPHILGVDVAGIVVEIGEGVTNVSVGDRVVYHGNLTKHDGGYAEYAKTTAHTVSKIPSGVSMEEAAAIPCAGYTAYQALFHKMNVRKGMSILIHAGAGGVGSFAIQLAKQVGATVYTTASAQNEEWVRSLGADEVIDYNKEDFVQVILEKTNGRGVDAVLDAVNRENATRSLEALAFNGHIAFIAGQPDYTVVKPFRKALSFSEVALGAAHFSNNRQAQEQLAQMGDILLNMVAEKTLNPIVERIISLEEVPTALEQLSQRHVRGKIVAKLK